jgi:hypothetical protein
MRQTSPESEASASQWLPDAVRGQWPGVGVMQTIRVSVAGKDVIMEAEESAVMGAVTRRRLLKN